MYTHIRITYIHIQYLSISYTGPRPGTSGGQVLHPARKTRLDANSYYNSNCITTTTTNHNNNNNHVDRAKPPDERSWSPPGDLASASYIYIYIYIQHNVT